jgi:hypothetical protein
LDLKETVANSTGAMAAVVGALVPWQLRQQQAQQQQQTPYTYGLKLEIAGSWEPDKEVWQMLARLTQLAGLHRRSQGD